MLDAVCLQSTSSEIHLGKTPLRHVTQLLPH